VTQASFLGAIGKASSPSAPVAVTPAGGELRQGKAGYPVREIVVHCSATPPEWMAGRSLAAKREEIKRWHTQERGWRDIGYHWLIDRDGTYAQGRPETEIGAGVAGHNSGVIHVCLIGGKDSDTRDDFRDHFTAAQEATLTGLIASIRTRARITRVSGHNEHDSGKACPGFWVPQALPKLGISVEV
jgi:hypothetical protein